MRKHISYASVTATVALVFAMTGTGIAASRYFITSTSQIKPSVVRQLEASHIVAATKTVVGTPGSQGPAGANGAQGPPGSNATLGEPIEVKVEDTGEIGAYAEALCPVGDVFLFGKGHVKGTPALEQEAKVDTKGRVGWFVSAVGTTGTFTVSATAYCVKGAS